MNVIYYYMIEINTKEDIANIDKLDDYAVLTQDIDASDGKNVLISTITESGVLEGGNHTIYCDTTLVDENYGEITNLTVENYEKTTTLRTKFFGGVVNKNFGKIENVEIGLFIFEGVDCVGGVAGYNSGRISNCQTRAMMNGRYNVGGIAGFNSGVVVCCNSKSMISGFDNVGQLVGYNYSGGEIIGQNNMSGKVINNNKTNTIGGIIGFNWNDNT